jgi:hypothetical protein
VSPDDSVAGGVGSSGICVNQHSGPISSLCWLTAIFCSPEAGAGACPRVRPDTDSCRR